MSRFACVIAVLLLVGLPASGAAQLQLPQPVGYVNDFAHVIPQAQADSIERIIDEVRAKSGGEIVVVTLPSLQGNPVDEVALQIGRQWKIGKSGSPTDSSRATGAVVLVVPKETSDDGRGHLKIETGIGTTQFITAAEAGRIADRYMVPFFRQKDYGSGILHGVAGIAQQYAEFFHFQLTGVVPQQPRSAPQSGGGFGRIIFWGIIILVILAMIFGGRGGGGGGRGGRRRRHSTLPFLLPFLIGGGHRGGWGGFGGGLGGFGGGGGFGGFGGSGGFGGGGAGRSW